VSLALSRDDELVKCCRTIIMEGTGSRSRPGKGFKGEPTGLLDALAGRGEPREGALLIGTIREKLWPAWPDDWFKGHIEGLYGEFYYRLVKTLDNPDQLRQVADAMMRDAVATMSSNPSTPPRFLAAARDRLIRVGPAAPREPGR
jgi:hypothetical protein